MNNELQSFARESIKEGLSKLPENWVKRFKQMYGRDNGKRSLEDCEAMDIQDVILEIPADKLDWAMQQITNSIRKLEA